MKRREATWSLVCGLALLGGPCACDKQTEPQSPAQVVGTDERGNALATRIAVVDSAGLPVAGVVVESRKADWLEGEPLDSAGPFPSASRAVTGADGICLIVLSRTDSQIVRAGDRRMASALRTQGEPPRELRMVLAPTGTIQGAATRYGSGSQVRLRGLSGSAWTDAKGRFSLPGVPAGMFRLEIDAATPIRLDTVSAKARTAVRLVEPTILGPNARVTFAASDLPSPPLVSPAGGVFMGAISVTVQPGDSADVVETSIDGIHWDSGSSRTIPVSNSGCLHARSVHGGQIMSQTVEACFQIGS